AGTTRAYQMRIYRKLILSFVAVATAVPMLVGCGSNEFPGSKSGTPLGVENSAIQAADGDGAQAAGPPKLSFSMDIQPIFDNRCVDCHNAGLLRGTLDLTAGSSYDNLVNQPTSAGCMAEVPDSIRVVPCDPMSSMLWLKTRPDDARCRMPMPFGTDGLGVIAPDEFALIELWIAEGAQNN